MIERYDAAVVLGAGIDENGVFPDPEGKQRVEKAYEMYQAGQTDIVIVTGNRTFTRRPTGKPPQAEAIKRYGIHLGIPDEAIIPEPQALETVGHAVFTKRITEPLGLRRLAVVSTETHVPRGVDCFQRVAGPEYDITGVSSGAFEERKTQYLQEAAGNFLVHAILGGTEPGDDETITRRLFGLIPGYDDISSARIALNYFYRFAHLEGLLGRQNSEAA